jgi:ferric-dicitrate binding protein FerR (iron transport regulator)
MTDDRSKKHIDDETVAKWVRELPDAEPDAEFRERLRSAFVSGEIDSPDAAAAPEAPAARPSRASARAPWWRWLVPVATAMAVIAVFMFNRGPALEVIEATGEVTVGGRPLADATPLPGATVEVAAGATLDIAAKGSAIYEVVGGTRMTLPESPGRWWGKAAACSLFVGELRLKTGAKFAGTELRVYTPEGLVVVTGTLLSVQCDEGGTCVCVLEGTARVGVDEADLEPVSPGFRKIMLRDGTKEIIPVKPMHRDGVLDFDDRVGSRIE